MAYISFNCKYYKDSNKNELGHVDRTHKKVESSNENYRHKNFGDNNLIYKYESVYKKVEEAKGKKIQKNSNTFIDGVLSFDRDQVNKLINHLGEEKFKKVMDQKIRNYMDILKEKFGLEPVGYHFHGDEGHTKDGVWLENYHAQIILFNYDFKTNTAPLRKMSARGSNSPFSLMQDLAGAVFEPLGFERGVSKEVTKKRHLEKDDFITKKHHDQELKIKTLNKDIKEYKDKLKEVESYIENEVASYSLILEDAKNLIKISGSDSEKMKIFSEAYKFIEDLFLRNASVNKFFNSAYKSIKSKDKDTLEKVEKTIDLLRVENGSKPYFNSVSQSLSFAEKIKILNDLGQKINDKNPTTDLKKPKKTNTFNYN